MSFPPATEMFQFAGFASHGYVFTTRYPKWVGCPIRRSPDQSLLAAPQGFSQPVTSFIASQCQGIHQMPFRHLISQPHAGIRRQRSGIGCQMSDNRSRRSVQRARVWRPPSRVGRGPIAIVRRLVCQRKKIPRHPQPKGPPTARHLLPSSSQ